MNVTTKLVRWTHYSPFSTMMMRCTCSVCGCFALARWAVVAAPRDWFCCTKHCANQAVLLAISGEVCKPIPCDEAEMKPRRQKRVRVEGATTCRSGHRKR